jgi:Uma2 family endonuclease
MASVAKQLHMSLAGFLDWDDGTDTLYELVDGRIVAMAAPSDAHGTIVINLGAELKQVLQPPCRVVGNAGITLPERDDRYYVADLAVTCDQPASQRPFLPEPRLIVEVSSRSTAAHDRGVKGEDYRQLRSVQEILFVSSGRPAPPRRRAMGVIKDFIGDASMRLASLKTTVSRSAIYAGVAFGELPALMKVMAGESGLRRSSSSAPSRGGASRGQRGGRSWRG